MEIIKNNGKRCILWLSCDCCEDDGVIVVPDTGAFKVVEVPELLQTTYPFDTLKPSFQMRQTTELVSVGGVIQTRNVDYSVDYTSNRVYLFHGNEPIIPYENVVISYITGDSDLGSVSEPIIPSTTLRENDTLLLSFVPKEGTEEVFIGGLQQTRNVDYSIDYATKTITIFEGNEPKLPYENVMVSYFKTQ